MRPALHHAGGHRSGLPGFSPRLWRSQGLPTGAALVLVVSLLIGLFFSTGSKKGRRAVSGPRICWVFRRPCCLLVVAGLAPLMRPSANNRQRSGVLALTVQSPNGEELLVISAICDISVVYYSKQPL